MFLIISFENSLFVFDLCYNSHSYKSDGISCKNTFGVKKARPSKVESYLEVNTRADWQQEDLILECGQGLAY